MILGNTVRINEMLVTLRGQRVKTFFHFYTSQMEQ